MVWISKKYKYSPVLMEYMIITSIIESVLSEVFSAMFVKALPLPHLLTPVLLRRKITIRTAVSIMSAETAIVEPVETIH